MTFIITVLFLLLGLFVTDGNAHHRAHYQKYDVLRPNIVFFLTDDQDIQLGGMIPLVKTKQLIGSEGITFTNAFVSTPICCPSRSSVLTGLYQHNHGVMNNSFAGNCNGRSWQQGPEKQAFPVYLKRANYTTFYAGKYLNQYGFEHSGGASHVPPGWDEWVALIGNSKYYNYSLSINGRLEEHRSNPLKDYFTDVITNRSVQFLEQYNPSQGPLFMMLSPPASHAPFTPSLKYSHYFSDVKAPRTPHFNISSGKRKHWLLRHSPDHLSNEVINYIDEVFQNRWRTLLSVDDMVEKVIETLQMKNMLENTYIFFASDHGYHLGQFSLPMDKRQMYEFDIRVPMLVRGPGIAAGQVRSEIVLNIDLAPTFVHLSGLPPPTTMDGRSLVPLLVTPNISWRSSFLLEYHGEGYYSPIPNCPQLVGSGLANCIPACICEDSKNNTYTCVRIMTTELNMVYCQFQDDENFVEMYDLNDDPYELVNLASGGPVAEAMQQFLKQLLHQQRTCQGSSCWAT